MPPIQPFNDYPLSSTAAHLLALSFSVSYVGSLYFVKNVRSRSLDPRTRITPGSRDDPAVIRSRLAAVTVATTLNCIIVYVLVQKSSPPSSAHTLSTTLNLLGVRWPENALSFFQTPVLFLGPLYVSYISSTLPGQYRFSMQRDFTDVFYSLIGFRNYVWGPLTEEIVFRGCVLAVYAMSGVSRGKMIAFAPLAFGLAHFHHARETYNRLGKNKDALKRALLGALFQTAYTTVFGAHTSYLFLRTSSILPPLTAHIFCNIMGIPQIQDELRRFPKKRGQIRTAYIVGILLFAGTLVPWTKSEGSVYWRAPVEFWKAWIE
ncbi:hypothetical protein FB45DRAFT_935875 [Roridomyces roridus]|uniref:intramembrane prenyl-peptidase Rce1 n=1 Tax=Roridomyces roridus TaxID=1738132 RepID=A0AAD7FEH7_9AGAR|nr:hypothetical protein FB45DRAFT_935875 [Roridomyces roridus]